MPRRYSSYAETTALDGTTKGSRRPAADADDGDKPAKKRPQRHGPIPKTAADFARARLDKLLEDPTKEVIIPAKSQERKPREPPEFIRNIWGSSSGVGSGDFHLYRQIRRREYARQHYLDKKQERDSRDEDWHLTQVGNVAEATLRTEKRRLKRLRRKQSQQRRKNAAKGDKTSDESDSESGESDSSDASTASGHRSPPAISEPRAPTPADAPNPRATSPHATTTCAATPSAATPETPVAPIVSDQCSAPEIIEIARQSPTDKTDVN